MEDPKTPMDPCKTILVVKKDGKKVGSVPATAMNASAYLAEMARHYGKIQVMAEPDETGGLLASLHGGHIPLPPGY